MFRPDPPQGFSTDEGLIIIGRPPIPMFSPPQGMADGVAPDTVDNILAVYPPIADATFQFYKFYQINKGQVLSTQTNMPVVIIDTLGSGIFDEGASGFDIRAFNSNGAAIDYEVESVNTATGDIVVWINMATVKDSEFVQLTFGKASATDGSNPAAVYDSNYKMVLHMDAALLDSTSNNNDATNNGSTDAVGKISRGRDFNGTTQFMEVSDSASLNITTNLTLSGWILSSNTDGWVMGKDNVAGNRPYSMRRMGGVTPILRFGLDTGTTIFLDGLTQLSDVTFDYVVATYDGSNMKIYVNGVFDTEVSESGAIDTNAISLFIGKRGDNSIFYAGTIDELRISDIARSADWINTEFNNQNDNNTFWFETPILENGISNFLVDHLGNQIVAVGQ